jgi:nitrogenase-stabilizing/protective protein
VTRVHLPDAIAQIESAEDLFELLDVDFDPALLAVHRIAILKRFGQEVAMLERRRPPLSEGERRPLYAAALERTHALYARGGSDIEPLFRPRPRDVVAVERLRRTVSRSNTT